MENLPLWHPSLDGTDDEILARADAILRARMRDGLHITEPKVAGDMLRYRLAGRDREFFTVILLDTRHGVIDVVDLHAGTIDGAEVHPREVARLALLRNAACVIVGHNHPSGNPEPSAADRAVTARLKQALSLLDIRLLDHFVVANNGVVSLAARGWV